MKKTKNITTKELCLIGLFIALIAVGAFIKIPLPLIPLTLQTFFVLLAGLLLGARNGSLAVIGYILLGLSGLPVFASGGGIGYVLNPSFGYLLGFAIGAYIIGKIAHGAKLSFLRILIANLVGILIIYFLGMIYFYFISNFYLGNPVGVWALFTKQFIFTVPKDIFVCFVTALLGTRLIPITKKLS